MFLILTLGALSVLLALILTPIVRDRIGKFGFLDHPDGVRKKHATAVPRVGGIAIAVAYRVDIRHRLRFAVQLYVRAAPGASKHIAPRSGRIGDPGDRRAGRPFALERLEETVWNRCRRSAGLRRRNSGGHSHSPWLAGLARSGIRPDGNLAHRLHERVQSHRRYGRSGGWAWAWWLLSPC